MRYFLKIKQKNADAMKGDRENSAGSKKM